MSATAEDLFESHSSNLVMGLDRIQEKDKTFVVADSAKGLEAIVSRALAYEIKGLQTQLLQNRLRAAIYSQYKAAILMDHEHIQGFNRSAKLFEEQLQREYMHLFQSIKEKLEQVQVPVDAFLIDEKMALYLSAELQPASTIERITADILSLLPDAKDPSDFSTSAYVLPSSTIIAAISPLLKAEEHFVGEKTLSAQNENHSISAEFSSKSSYTSKQFPRAPKTSSSNSHDFRGAIGSHLDQTAHGRSWTFEEFNPSRQDESRQNTTKESLDSAPSSIHVASDTLDAVADNDCSDFLSALGNPGSRFERLPSGRVSNHSASRSMSPQIQRVMRTGERQSSNVDPPVSTAYKSVELPGRSDFSDIISQNELLNSQLRTDSRVLHTRIQNSEDRHRRRVAEKEKRIHQLQDENAQLRNDLGIERDKNKRMSSKLENLESLQLHLKVNLSSVQNESQVEHTKLRKSFEKETAKLKETLRNYQIKYDEIVHERARLLTEMEQLKLQSIHIQLQKEGTATQAQLSHCEETIGLTVRCSRLEDQLQKSRSEVEVLRKQFAELSTSNKELSSAEAKVNQSLVHEKDRSSILEARMQEMSQLFSKKEKDWQEVETKLIGDLSTTKAKLENLELFVRGIEAELQESQKREQVAKKNCMEAQAAQSRAEQELNKQHTASLECQREMRNLRQEKESLTNRLLDAQAQVDAILAQTSASPRHTIQDATTSTGDDSPLQPMKQLSRGIGHNPAFCDDQAHSGENMIHETRQTYIDQLVELRQEIESLRLRVPTQPYITQSVHDALALQLSEARDTIRSMDLDRIRSEKTILELQSELNKNKAIDVQLNRMLEALRQDNNDLLTQLQESQNRAVALETKVRDATRDLTRERERLSSQVASIKVQDEAKTRNIAILHDEIDRMEQESRQQKEEIARLKGVNQSLQSQIELYQTSLTLDSMTFDLASTSIRHQGDAGNQDFASIPSSSSVPPTYSKSLETEQSGHDTLSNPRFYLLRSSRNPILESSSYASAEPVRGLSHRNLETDMDGVDGKDANELQRRDSLPSAATPLSISEASHGDANDIGVCVDEDHESNLSGFERAEVVAKPNVETRYFEKVSRLKGALESALFITTDNADPEASADIKPGVPIFDSLQNLQDAFEELLSVILYTEGQLPATKDAAEACLLENESHPQPQSVKDLVLLPRRSLEDLLLPVCSLIDLPGPSPDDPPLVALRQILMLTRQSLENHAAKLHSMQSNIDMLNQSLENCNQEEANARREKDRTMHSLALANDKLHGMEQSIKELQEQLDVSEQENRSLGETIHKMKAMNKVLKGQVIDLQEKVSELTDASTQKDLTHKMSIQEASQKIEHFKGALEQKTEAYSTLRDQEIALKAKVSALEADIELLKAQYDQDTASLRRNMEAEINILTHDINSLRVENEQLKSKLVENQTEEDEIPASDPVPALERQILELKGQLEQKESACISLSSKHISAIDSYKQMISQTEEQHALKIAQLESSYTQALRLEKGRLKTMEESLKQLQDTCESYAFEIRKLELERSQLISQLDEERATRRELEAANHPSQEILLERLKEQEKNRKTLLSRQIELEAEIHDLKSQVEVMQIQRRSSSRSLSRNDPPINGSPFRPSLPGNSQEVTSDHERLLHTGEEMQPTIVPWDDLGPLLHSLDDTISATLTQINDQASLSNWKRVMELCPKKDVIILSPSNSRSPAYLVEDSAPSPVIQRPSSLNLQARSRGFRLPFSELTVDRSDTRMSANETPMDHDSLDLGQVDQSSETGAETQHAENPVAHQHRTDSKYQCIMCLELENKLSSLQAAFDSTTQELLTYQEELKEAETKTQALDSQLLEKEAIHSDAVLRLNSELDDLQGYRDQCQQKDSLLKKCREELESKIKLHADVQSELTVTREKAESERTRLLQQLDYCKSQMQGKDESILALNRRVQILESELSSMHSQIENLQEEKQSLIGNLADRNASEKQLLDANKMMQSEVEGLSEQLASLLTKMDMCIMFDQSGHEAIASGSDSTAEQSIVKSDSRPDLRIDVAPHDSSTIDQARLAMSSVHVESSAYNAEAGEKATRSSAGSSSYLLQQLSSKVLELLDRISFLEVENMRWKSQCHSSEEKLLIASEDNQKMASELQETRSLFLKVSEQNENGELIQTELKQQISTSQARISQLEMECNNLQARLDDTERKAEQSKESAGNLLRETESKLTRLIEETEGKYQQLLRELESKDSYLASQDIRNQELSEAITNLTASLELKESALNEMVVKHQSLEQSLQQKQHEVQSLAQNLADQSRIAQALENNHQSTNQTLQLAQAQLVECKDVWRQSQEKIDLLHGAIEQLETELLNTKDELQTTKKELIENEVVLSEVEKLKNAGDILLLEEREKCTQITAQCFQQTSKIESLEKAVAECKEKLCNETIRFEKEAKDKDDQMQKMHIELQTLETQLDDKSKENTELVVCVDQLRADLEDQTKGKLECENKLQALVSRFEQQVQSYENTESRLCDALKEIKRLEDQVAESSSTIWDLQQNLDERDCRIEQLTRQEFDLVGKHKDAIEALDKLKNELEDCKAREVNLEAEALQLKSLLPAYSDNVQKMEEKTIELEEHIAQQQQNAKALKEKIDELSAQNSALVSEVSELRDKISFQMQDHQTALSQYQTDLKNSADEVARLEKQYQFVLDDVQDKSKQITQLCAEKEETQTALQQLQIENGAQSEEISKAISVIEKLKQEIQTLKDARELAGRVAVEEIQRLKSLYEEQVLQAEMTLGEERSRNDGETGRLREQIRKLSKATQLFGSEMVQIASVLREYDPEAKISDEVLVSAFVEEMSRCISAGEEINLGWVNGMVSAAQSACGISGVVLDLMGALIDLKKTVQLETVPRKLFEETEKKLAEKILESNAQERRYQERLQQQQTVVDMVSEHLAQLIEHEKEDHTTALEIAKNMKMSSEVICSALYHNPNLLIRGRDMSNVSILTHRSHNTSIYTAPLSDGNRNSARTSIGAAADIGQSSPMSASIEQFLSEAFQTMQKHLDSV
eukprot:TRINITY_DN6727_c0_g1_i1.p1 TRINITY_DN6727_c0_g1~~TRINITY_DN6727_c0_g1_i1.p1  ORF type:complete len:3040 (-),score=671.66 TRINITY_DN6727_c0_g1_i1:187-9306(-)